MLKCQILKLYRNEKDYIIDYMPEPQSQNVLQIDTELDEELTTKHGEAHEDKKKQGNEGEYRQTQDDWWSS